MSDEDNTRTVVSLLGPDTGAPALAVPDTGAHLALYGFRDGRLFEVVSAADEDEYGARMIALGKSHRRGALARWLRRS
jgi:hypothetical protein